MGDCALSDQLILRTIVQVSLQVSNYSMLWFQSVIDSCCLLACRKIMAATTPTDIGGYDYTFVNTPPDRLVCRICDYVSRDPRMSECCGHNFCESCLENANKAASITKACPICRDDGFTTYRNKQADREARNLEIACPNEEMGCTWQGEINHVSGHFVDNILGCEYENVKCTNFDCEEMVQRRSLRDHVWMDCLHRTSRCQYCRTYDKYLFIIGDHVKQCPKYPLPCPNNCEVESVLREDMETHKKECPLEVIQCEYHNMGCEERMMRKNKRKHEEEHMDELSWPLKERFEIKLLNQISNHEHHMHIVIYDHTVSRLNADRIYDDNIWVIPSLYGNGQAQFISNTDLYKVTPTCQYLKDECIFLQVNIL